MQLNVSTWLSGEEEPERIPSYTERQKGGFWGYEIKILPFSLRLSLSATPANKTTCLSSRNYIPHAKGLVSIWGIDKV